jgi:hypothetical protein
VRRQRIDLVARMIFRRLERRLDAGFTPLPRGRRLLEGSQHRGQRVFPVSRCA